MNEFVEFKLPSDSLQAIKNIKPIRPNLALEYEFYRAKKQKELQTVPQIQVFKCYI